MKYGTCDGKKIRVAATPGLSCIKNTSGLIGLMLARTLVRLHKPMDSDLGDEYSRV